MPSIFTFPKGARPGTLLHSLFETIDFQSAAGEALEQHIADLLLQEGFDASWAPVLRQQVEAVLDTQLDTGFGEPVRLRDLAPERKQVELEFFLPMGRVTAPVLTANNLARARQMCEAFDDGAAACAAHQPPRAA